MLAQIGTVDFFLPEKSVFEHPLSNVCVSDDNQGHVVSKIQYLSSQNRGFPLFIFETLVSYIVGHSELLGPALVSPLLLKKIFV
jgi:hypothetical protein